MRARWMTLVPIKSTRPQDGSLVEQKTKLNVASTPISHIHRELVTCTSGGGLVERFKGRNKGLNPTASFLMVLN